MSLIGYTSFGFAQNTKYDFQNIELKVALSLTNAKKNFRKHCGETKQKKHNVGENSQGSPQKFLKA